jgi:triosephosphate isomerase
MPEIDGLFIGRSAWDAENFKKIILNVYKLWKDLN